MAESGTQPEPPALTFGPTVTILFSDIRGFTEYTDTYGDEAGYRMLQHHNNLLEEQIALHQGHIVKRLGDSFMVSFDAARMAVSCAVAMHRMLDQDNRAQTGPKIEIGVGIDTGEPIREADDFFGGTVNRASRICGAAGAGRVLVSEAVRHVVGRLEGSQWIDRGFFDVKGFEEPQHLFELDWTAGAAVRATAVAAPRVPRATAEPPSPAPGPAAAAVPAATARPKAVWIAGAAAAVLVVAAVGGVALFMGRTGAPATPTEQPVAQQPAPAQQPPSGAPAQPEGRLLRSDDFSNPAGGLFRNNQQGTGQFRFRSGQSAEYGWQYGYREGSLVARITGQYPQNPQQAFLAAGALSTDKVLGDFAVEVRARATKSPGQARFGITYFLQPEDWYVFSVGVEDRSYGIAWAQENLAFSRSSTISPGNEENLLRVEVRGDTARMFINGSEVDRVQHEGLARRGGDLRLSWVLSGPPDDGELEVRFDDFKVYALDS